MKTVVLSFSVMIVCLTGFAILSVIGVLSLYEVARLSGAAPDNANVHAYLALAGAAGCLLIGWDAAKVFDAASEHLI